MNDDLREDRKAQIAELQLALKVAVEALDRLEQRMTTKQILDVGSLQIDLTKRIASQITSPWQGRRRVKLKFQILPVAPAFSRIAGFALARSSRQCGRSRL